MNIYIMRYNGVYRVKGVPYQILTKINQGNIAMIQKINMNICVGMYKIFKVLSNSTHYNQRLHKTSSQVDKLIYTCL